MFLSLLHLCKNKNVLCKFWTKITYGCYSGFIDSSYLFCGTKIRLHTTNQISTKISFVYLVSELKDFSFGPHTPPTATCSFKLKLIRSCEWSPERIRTPLVGRIQQVSMGFALDPCIIRRWPANEDGHKRKVREKRVRGI